jgi:hypothetical protein
LDTPSGMALTDVGECASSQGLFHVTTAARSAALRRSESRRGMFEACAEPDRQPSPRLISRSLFLPQVPGSIIKNCVGSLAGQGDDPVDYRRVAVVLVVPHRYTAITQILIDPTDFHAVGNDLTPTNQANDEAVLQVESQFEF